MLESKNQLKQKVIDSLKIQIETKDPIIAEQTYKRLLADKESLDSILDRMSTVLLVEVYDNLSNNSDFNLERYTKNLNNLPTISELNKLKN